MVDNAGVAKGTFYLYFSDKYDLRNKLIAHKAGCPVSGVHITR
ncbi:MAG: TetR family transcriptional regulator [Lachnospiraceae bacterium]